VGGTRRAGGSNAPGNEALSAGKRFYATVTPSFDPKEDAPGLCPQVEATFAALAGHLSHAGFQFSDLVQLHATLSHVADAALLRAHADTILGDTAAALTIIIAPLPDPALRFQIEAYAFAGGGRWIGEGRNTVLAGEEVYFGSQLGYGPDGAMLQGPERQIDAAWHGIEALLASVDCPPENVLRTNNILTDWRDYAAFNRGYGRHVARPYPPRTTVLASLEDPEARTQIEGIAYCGSADATIIDVRPEE